MALSSIINGKLSDQISNAEQIKAIRNAFNTVKKRQKENISRISNIEERKKRLQKTKEYCTGNQSLLELAVKNLRSNGVKVHIARTKEEALSIVQDEIGDEKLIVKSKSNVSKEIGLNKFLESKGVNIIETDIGDRIIQLAKDNPSHPTGPASHLTRYDIAEILFEHLGEFVEPDPETLTKIFRDEISGFIGKANIGITGANAVAAEEGAIMLLHNEGNILEVMHRPKKHIILAGIDKIYPDIDEAFNAAKLQTFFATGSIITSYINVISGPSKTADIEKKLFKGIHGPEEVCLILIDNNRTDMINKGFKELLYCIGCGECLLNCPTYNVFGKRYGNGSHLGGKGVAYSTLLNDTESLDNNPLYLCVSCGHCKEHCPLSIDTPSIINKLRVMYPQKFSEPYLELPYDFLDSHIIWLKETVRIEILLLISNMLRKERGNKKNECLGRSAEMREQ